MRLGEVVAPDDDRRPGSPARRGRWRPGRPSCRRRPRRPRGRRSPGPRGRWPRSRRRRPRSARARRRRGAGSARPTRRSPPGRGSRCRRRAPRRGTPSSARRPATSQGALMRAPSRWAWIGGPGGQLLAGDAVGEADVVLDERAGARLAAGGDRVERHRVEALGRAVDRRGQPGRPAAHDHEVERVAGRRLEREPEVLRRARPAWRCAA